MGSENILLEHDQFFTIYGDLHAVDDLNLTVPECEWLAIVGSSGSGKRRHKHGLVPVYMFHSLSPACAGDEGVCHT